MSVWHWYCIDVLVWCYCPVISCLLRSMRTYLPVHGVIAALLLQACLRSTWHVAVFFRQKLSSWICCLKIVSAEFLRFASAEFVRFASAPFVRLWLSTVCQSYFRSTHLSSDCHRSAQVCYSEWLPLRSSMPSSEHIAVSYKQDLTSSILVLCWVLSKGSFQECSLAQLSQHLIRMFLLFRLVLLLCQFWSTITIVP